MAKDMRTQPTSQNSIPKPQLFDSCSCVHKVQPILCVFIEHLCFSSFTRSIFNRSRLYSADRKVSASKSNTVAIVLRGKFERTNGTCLDSGAVVLLVCLWNSTIPSTQDRFSPSPLRIQGAEGGLAIMDCRVERFPWVVSHMCILSSTRPCISLELWNFFLWCWTRTTITTTNLVMYTTSQLMWDPKCMAASFGRSAHKPGRSESIGRENWQKVRLRTTCPSLSSSTYQAPVGMLMLPSQPCWSVGFSVHHDQTNPSSAGGCTRHQ